jgi:CarboxypepD_reg-like domain/TonB-dependent Receptor Plug Domain
LRHFLLQIWFQLLTALVGFSQESFLITGTIRDSLTNEPLIGATIHNPNGMTGITSDVQGTFSLKVPGGDITLEASYIGYTTKTVRLSVHKNLRIDFRLSEKITETREVIITARNPSENTESSKTGFIELTGKEMEKLPSLMGEPDLIRALQYSPGVQNAGDGNSGFYVRGGNVDQNLILLDNAVVYNPSHVLGFFSVFNTDIISSAALIKSGIPSNYGGRLSSVLTVKTIDGDYERQYRNDIFKSEF